MLRARLSQKPGKRVGHLSMSGPKGSIVALVGLDLGREILDHMNNTNPVLRPKSAASAQSEAAGCTIGQDGKEIAR